MVRQVVPELVEGLTNRGSTGSPTVQGDAGACTGMGINPTPPWSPGLLATL